MASPLKSAGSSPADRPRTVGAVLVRHRGVGPGFDLLRLGLALAVVFHHASFLGDTLGVCLVTDLGAPGDGGWLVALKRPVLLAIVPMFFALSGFLVMGSALRLRSTGRFLFFRALRIVPALSVEVLLAALVLGPLLTTVSLRAYFGDYLFWSYFGNIVGFPHMRLPGLFAGSSFPDVTNGSLWTLPAEFRCYLVLSVGMVTGVLYRRRLTTGLFLAATLVLLAASLATGYAVSPDTTYPVSVVTYYFFVGVMFYVWRDSIPVSPWAVPPLAVASYLLLLGERTVFVAPLVLVYLTVNVGMLALPEVSRLLKGDYSYGLYLYHFPVAQALLTTVHGFRGHGWLLFGATVAGAGLVSALSWHLVERPTLRLKALASRRDRPIVARFAPAPAE